MLLARKENVNFFAVRNKFYSHSSMVIYLIVSFEQLLDNLADKNYYLK